MVYGDGLEKRQYEWHVVPSDTILHVPVRDETDFCMWRCHPISLGAKQFVGKMLTKSQWLRAIARPYHFQFKGIDKLSRQDYIRVPNIENGKEDTNVNRREQGLGWPLA